MSILSDGQISSWMESGEISIDPPPEDNQIQPASVDLRLGGQFIHIGKHNGSFDETIISSRRGTGHPSIIEHVHHGDGFVLRPGEFVLAHTQETVGLGHRIVGVVDGRSSLGRIGVMVHITAGYIDPGFKGQITLEMHNVSPNPVELFVGDRVCQIRFHLMSLASAKPYQGKYQGDTGAVMSRIQSDHEAEK